MATTRGYTPPFLAAEGGRIPYPYSDGGGYDDPYGDTYGPGDPYGGTADSDVTGPSSGAGQAAGSGSTGSGFFSGLNEPVADLGLGSFNPTPLGLGLTALGMVPGPIGLVANVLGLGRAVANVLGPSVPGQVSGFGTTTGGPTGLGIGVTGQAVDPNMEAVAGLADFTAEVEARGMDPMGVVGDVNSDQSDSTGGNGGVGGDVGDDWSDIRLKRSVQYLGDASGLRKYSWNYVWGGPRKVGVMAHELLGTKYADAVRVVDGYMRVDYSQLPAEVRTV